MTPSLVNGGLEAPQLRAYIGDGGALGYRQVFYALAPYSTILPVTPFTLITRSTSRMTSFWRSIM